ncbi:hypothetical protein PF008_g25047 [Phytophthora fragariae]|uniref:Ubiquitin-like protease family profile domain-containing protein n=2 Tax=Phytophthora fragariae TaxID=53985 RepID=A0A6G0QL50_9STRA|nr:hypothetical protein PF008_g25047 [Phytophthora fragariae]
MILIQHNSDNEDALDEPRAEYSVNKRDWVCSCLFMSSRLLPCRHVFYLRKALNYENVIPTQLLNPRWLISTLRSKNDVVEFSGESFAMAPVMQEPNVVWDSNRKFREASAVTKTINEHLSGLGMREYKTAIRALHNIATLFKHGQFDVILDASEQRLECHGGELFGDTEFADALSENDSNSVVNEASAGVLEGADISHSIKFAGHETGSFAIEKDPDLPEKLKSIPIMTSKATILDWTARQLISDEAMMDVLSRKYGSASGISVIDPSSLGVVVEGTVRAPRKDIQRGMASLSTEKVLVPLNCGGNHWCAILMDLSKGECYVYDSTASSYISSVRAVAQTMLDLLPPGAHKTFRARIYDPGLGIQSDNYNCGIYVLLAFEIFCEAEPLGLVNRSMLQCMRYRYLRMCL